MQSVASASGETPRPSLELLGSSRNVRVVALEAATVLTIGRSRGCDVVLDWDREVSRIHAVLVRTKSSWVLIDAGLSRNGTFVNNELRPASCRLRDADLVRIGRTLIVFRARAVRVRRAEPGVNRLARRWLLKD